MTEVAPPVARAKLALSLPRLLALASAGFGCAALTAISAAQAPLLSSSLVIISYVLLCAYFCWPERQHQANRNNTASWQQAGFVIAYASQTGFAHSLAQQSWAHFDEAGLAARLCPIEQLDQAALQQIDKLLLIVSTSGEGDAPDHAQVWWQQLMQASAPALQQLKFAILALGDKHYQHFCQFGHQLEQALSARGAEAWFDLIEVDNADAAAIRHWQHQLAQLSGHRQANDWEAPAYQDWQLLNRELLNPGSQGDPVYKISLRPTDTTVSWQAGDIAEIGAPEYTASGTAAPLHSRDYSIASLCSEQKLELIVRLVHGNDGQAGLGSGWLCQRASLQQNIALRIRSNPHFHPYAGAHPLILIGNGTGIAGLRAHLNYRVQTGQRRNALFFGERQRAHDFLCRDELMQWQAQGFLPELELCFSRDQAEKYYVQDALRLRASLIQNWVAEGAEILVCGSLQGMASAVQHSLQEILGHDLLNELQAQGRYRRDVY